MRRDLDHTGPGGKHPFAAFEPRRPQEYRAPSWSWASLDGEITYASQRVVEVATVPPARILLSDTSGLEFAELGSSISQVPNNASVTVRGQMVHGMFRYLSTEPVEVRDCRRRLYNSRGDVMGFLYPDIMLEIQDLSHVSCLAVCDETSGSMDLKFERGESEGFSERVMGLALVPIPTCTGLFRRTGLIRWMQRSAFEDVAWSNIKIV